MKYIRSVLVLLLVLVFDIGMMPVAAAGATVIVGEATAHPGETVTVTVSATGFAEIAGIDLHFRYDATRLECVTGRAVGLAATMAMADTNTAVSGHPDEVWFTAMTMDSVSGDGDLVELTFRVKEDAPEGVATVALTKSDLSDTNYRTVTADTVDGGITVAEQDGATTAPSANGQTTAPVDTPTQGDAETTTVPMTAGTTVPMTAMTKPNGEEISLPDPEPATDINGNAMTDDAGEPLYVQGVAVTVDEVEAKPGETVTVHVAVSSVTDLTAMVLKMEYDPEALEYISGETEGLLKETMTWAAVMQDEAGAVSIGATHADGVSGEGLIATLRFKVKATADARDYRLSLRSDSEMQAGDIAVPLYLYSGEVRVMGENRNIVTPIVLVAVLVLIAVGTAALAMCATRKKTKGSAEE